MSNIIIDEEIFETFPNFRRGIIIVSDCENMKSNKRIRKPLNKIIAEKRDATLLSHEYVQAWDDAHRKFGSDPDASPPAIKSLLRRIIDTDGFPFINSVVALMNFISLKYLIPVGGDDLDKIEGNLRLCPAKGNEHFIPLGSEEEEHPEQDEVIYVDDKTNNVMCRRWNWRNSDITKITEGTKKIVINVDGIGPVPDDRICKARDELEDLLREHCNATCTTDFLHAGRREIRIKL